MKLSSEVARNALDAVVRRFALKDGAHRHVHSTKSGTRIRLEVARVSSLDARVATRVREDRVALRVLQEIETALSASVPPGMTLVFTLGAPIQRPRDLIAALTQRVRLRLETASDTATKAQIVGNRVRYQVSRRQLGCKAACLGFVFTGDLTPASLLNCMRQLGRALARRAPRGLAMTVDERWLLLVAEDTYVDIKTYRRLYACLSVSHNYKKVLLFKNGSKVEVLESPTSDAVVLGSHRKQC